jgi:hypothetical protein
MTISKWKKIVFFVLATACTVKSYTNVHPYPDVPALINKSIRTHPFVSSVNTNEKRYISYDLGIGKNEPVYNRQSSPSVVQLDDITKFWIEHEAVHEILSERQRLQMMKLTELHTPTTKKDRNNLPVVNLKRFTINEEIAIRPENNERIHAHAQQLITSHYDLNTPWIEILIHHEQQKIQNQKLHMSSA